MFLSWSIHELTRHIEIKQKMHLTNTKNEVENQLNKKKIKRIRTYRGEDEKKTNKMIKTISSTTFYSSKPFKKICNDLPF